jgi:hypothetical protein
MKNKLLLTMNLQAIKLFFLTVALVLLVACGGMSESDIEATVEARVEQAKASLIVPTVALYQPIPPHPL